ncbi:MAG: Methyltransferase type 11 [Parcubacteria group bacterium GW2011_GWC1_38_6]|nr:MAG: Methyltransferase type 11 [Parcubacteria group bacterium GW2011_GWC1_38_6]
MDTFLNPNQVLDQLDLLPNMIAADFGSGSGGWAIPLAKRLKSGKVFAIDILEEPLSALKSKAKLEKVWNIQTICANVENLRSARLGEGSLDFILITNLLFQSDKKEVILKEAYNLLKRGGKVLIVDWLPESSIGSEKDNVSPDEIKQTAERTGFSISKNIEVGHHHFGMVLIKS